MFLSIGMTDLLAHSTGTTRGVCFKEKMDEDPIPQLFFDGGCRVAVLMRQAYSDLDFCYFIEQVESVLGERAIGLMARIRRHAEGRMLLPPTEINDEADPFKAIKHAKLRAYFWEEVVSKGSASPLGAKDELLMCITHFAVKGQQKLDPEDTKVSKEERRHFLNTNCYYEED